MNHPVLQWIPLNEVRQYDKIKYNTNNLWTEYPPDDYEAVIAKTHTSSWIDQFKSYKKLDIDLCTPLTYWIKNAARIGIHTGKFPLAFTEERDALADDIESRNQDIFGNGHTKYFIRTENVSLKYGQHGAGPYLRMKEIIESLVSSIDGHNPIRKRAEIITLYFIPWCDTLDLSREYRGFVCNSKLTAISQQNLYTVYPISDVVRIHDAITIATYFTKEMVGRISQPTYTFDIAVLPDDVPYFIELNCFGANYAAGSALFGWHQDHDILTGKVDELIIRATCN